MTSALRDAKKERRQGDLLGNYQEGGLADGPVREGPFERKPEYRQGRPTIQIGGTESRPRECACKGPEAGTGHHLPSQARLVWLELGEQGESPGKSSWEAGKDLIREAPA